MTRRRVTPTRVPARPRRGRRTTIGLAGSLALTLAGAGSTAVASPSAGDGDPVARASAAAYVALGDSFSSGTGTRASTDSCYRSPYGYPALLAGAHGLDLDYQACSGATTAEVHARQLQALSADTDYVTMTIGGNDIGFADVITQCALPGWLSDCHGRINTSRSMLTGVMPGRYDALLTEIGSRAPGADVVVASYPRLFNGRDCNLATFFTRSEMAALNGATDELAALVQQRTQAAGFAYVDPRPAFTGHAVCDSPEWVNGISLPIQESYHPNRAGNVGYAEVFWPGTATAAGDAATGTDSTSSSSTDLRPDAFNPPAVEQSHAQQVRTQADAVLEMDLTSAANLRAARSGGVSTGEITRLVAQLRAGDTAQVERALAALRDLDTTHAAGR